MSNYLPYIFGISTLSFGIYKPKNTVNKESVLEKYRTLFKIISIIMILRGSYNLLNPDSNRYKVSQDHSSTNDIERQKESK